MPIFNFFFFLLDNRWEKRLNRIINMVIYLPSPNCLIGILWLELCRFHSASMPLGNLFLRKIKSSLQFGEYSTLLSCFSDGSGSLFPATNLQGRCFSEGPTAASSEFLEAPWEAAFPRRRAGLLGWPGDWKQGGLCPRCLRQLLPLGCH